MWATVLQSMPPPIALPEAPEPCSPDALEAALAARIGVPTDQVRVARAVLPAVLACLPPDAHVAVSEPTDPTSLAAIVAAGRRYVDAGRDHRFRIHPEGWRFALAGEQTGLALLGAPDEPTGTLPDPARLTDAAAAGVSVLVDQRYSVDPFAPALSCGSTWRSLGLLAPGAPEMLIGPPERLATLTLEPPSEASCGIGLAVTTAPEAPLARLDRWRLRARQRAWALAARGDLVVFPPAGFGVWTRLPGVPSAEAPPDAVGSPHWTWRDGVRWG